MVRHRTSRRKGLPANLYERGGYYSWRDPRTGQEHGLGRDRLEAIDQAIEANHFVAGSESKKRLVDTLGGRAQTLNEWLDVFEVELADREHASSTRAGWRSHVKAARGALGERVITRITTREVADFIQSYIATGKHRTAQSTRSHLFEIFRAAHERGWVTSNPVEATRHIAVKVKRARLTIESFIATYEAAGKIGVWLQNAMALAIVTGQRREDISNALFKDVHDDAWWCRQEKTGTGVMVPLGLRLDALGWSVGDVVRRCRDNVVSRYLIHHTRRRTKSNPGDQVWKDTISRRFTVALTMAEVKWPDGRTAPTFHEIRSLSERLYKAQGIDTQALLGHKDPRTTANYHDSRGAEWIKVQLG